VLRNYLKFLFIQHKNFSYLICGQNNVQIFQWHR